MHGFAQSAEFAFDIEVSDAAEPGPRQFTLQVQYRDSEGTQQTGDSIDAPVSIANSRDEFAVSAVNGTFKTGNGGTLSLQVTNNRNETVRDVSAKLFLDSPLSSGDDEGYISELAPGETKRVTFDLSVADAAIVNKTYPAEVDFRYETSGGDTLISDTYQVPIETMEAGSGGLPLRTISVAAVVVLLGIVGAVFIRRNR